MSLPLDFAEAVGEHEKRLIRIALADARFNQRRAAQRLSLTYHQFRGLLAGVDGCVSQEACRRGRGHRVHTMSGPDRAAADIQG